MHGTYCKAAKALLILLTGQASCLDGCRNEGRHKGSEMSDDGGLGAGAFCMYWQLISSFKQGKESKPFILH